MRQLKPAIQNAADRINDPMIDDDNIQAIKAMVLIDKTTQQAVQAHLVQKKIVSSQNRGNTIVTGEDIRKEMNREIGD